MQKPCARTDFGLLLARSWQVYSRGLNASFPIVLLCGTLPVFAVVAAIYFGLASAFAPVLRAMQTALRSLLENGFEQWALEAAMEQMQGSFVGLELLEILLRTVSSLGVMALVLLLLLPVVAVCRLVVTPIGRAAAMQVNYGALCGKKVRFSQAFSALKGYKARLIGLELLSVPPVIVLLMVAVLIAGIADDLPAADSVIRLVVLIGTVTVIGCVRRLAALIAVDRDLRAVDALAQAVRCFFTDWTYLASGGLFHVGLLGGTLLIAAADVLLMVLAMLPPLAVLLFASLLVPLMQAMCAVMYEEQRRREREKAASASEE